MREWASTLPGFDRTRHRISDIQVTLNGSNAEATAKVIASHWVNDLFWQVSGNYQYTLTKESELWKITQHTFNLTGEEGTRDVFDPATENAKKHPNAYIVRQQTRQTVLDFLQALERKDMESFNQFWAEDAVQEMPYVPEGFPSRVQGKENLIQHYAGWPENSGKSDFTSKIIFHPMQDPQMVFAEYPGESEIPLTGRLYKQHYGGLYHVVGGKIQLFREYFDPAPHAHAHAFGMGE